ncbi:hypothetical protein CJU89_2750 [Yarrowia sp. B02]|nr:hypothetical protein CJU89_2750 [Yarrowia sp. B02]
MTSLHRLPALIQELSELVGVEYALIALTPTRLDNSISPATATEVSSRPFDGRYFSVWASRELRKHIGAVVDETLIPELEEHRQAQDMPRMVLDMTDANAVMAYLAALLYVLQQETCKNIARTWIKHIEPKKQSKYPYKQGSLTAPPWWPETVTHREPDHLQKHERVELLSYFLLHSDFALETLMEASSENKDAVPGPKRMFVEQAYDVAHIWRLLHRTHYANEAVNAAQFAQHDVIDVYAVTYGQNRYERKDDPRTGARQTRGFGLPLPLQENRMAPTYSGNSTPRAVEPLLVNVPSRGWFPPLTAGERATAASRYHAGAYNPGYPHLSYPSFQGSVSYQTPTQVPYFSPPEQMRTPPSSSSSANTSVEDADYVLNKRPSAAEDGRPPKRSIKAPRLKRQRLMVPLLLLVLLGSLAWAQYSPEDLRSYYGLVEPTNRTQNNYNSFSLTVEGDYVSNIQALTVETDKLAGLNSAAAVSGNLRLVDGNYSGPALDWSNAALIDCDNTTDVIVALNEVLINNPACTILYSRDSDGCHFTRPYRVFSADLGFLFTTVSAKGALALVDKVQNSPVLLHSVAWLNVTSLPQDDTPVVDDKGPSKDTKIAMAVLYCICGVLALAVVVLISLGIWRVHRHPERYGLAPPQHDMEREISDDFNNGGGDVYTPPPTRVEKAKGLARAVLDAIPLMRVMKKSPEPVERAQTAEPTQEKAISASSSSMHKQEASTSSVKSSCDMSRMETLPVYIQQDDNCAICFDNFEDNQIIRQLPCTHRFHADCVDHWLLNSSSQCPMCRMNLRKDAEAEEAPETPEAPPQPERPAESSVITVTQRDLNISLATRIIDWWNMLCLPEDARAEARERLNRESELRRKIRQLQRSDGTLMLNDGIIATDDGALRVLLDNRPLQAPPIDVPLSERMLVPGPDLDLNNVEAPVPRYSVVPEQMYTSTPETQSQACLLPQVDLSEFSVEDFEAEAGRDDADATRVETVDEPDTHARADTPTNPEYFEFDFESAPPKPI